METMMKIQQKIADLELDFKVQLKRKKVSFNRELKAKCEQDILNIIKNYDMGLIETGEMIDQRIEVLKYWKACMYQWEEVE